MHNKELKLVNYIRLKKAWNPFLVNLQSLKIKKIYNIMYN